MAAEMLRITTRQRCYLIDALMMFMHHIENMPPGLKWEPAQFAELEELLTIIDPDPV